MAVSKVILNGTTLIDTTDKTVTSESMLSGVTALKNDGTTATGNIASKTSSDLTASGATVTTPAGYYASAASKSVASGTAGTPTATKGTVSNHSVSVTPSVTNTTGYIAGGTKNGTAVTVTAAELESGTKTITENGTGIDVTGYAAVDVDVPSSGGVTVNPLSVTQNGTYTAPSGTAYSPVTVNVSGGSALKMGVIRPDAELVKSWTYDKCIVADEGVAIGAYTTSSKALKTISGFESATVDFSNYNYYICTRALAKPVYSSSEKGIGRIEYVSQTRDVEYVSIPTTAVDVDGISPTTIAPLGIGTSTGVAPYWSSATVLNVTASELYGPNFQFSNPSVTSDSITPANVILRIRGNATYFTQTYWDLLTDIRYQFIIELYRISRNSLNLDGWGLQTQQLHDISCAQSSSGTLT